MAENVPASTPSSMPAAQAPAGAPNQQFDAAQGNGQNPSHMPPPPRPPVIIPQTNPIPTAMTSPLSGGMMSPTSAGGYVRRAAPEPNKRALYVGGLDPRVTEDILKQIFETTGHVVSVKIIPDKNVSFACLASVSLMLSCIRYGLCLFLSLSSLLFVIDILEPYNADRKSSSTVRDTTTASLSLMTPVPLREPCRPSTAAESTSRFVHSHSM